MASSGLSLLERGRDELAALGLMERQDSEREQFSDTADTAEDSRRLRFRVEVAAPRLPGTKCLLLNRLLVTEVGGCCRPPCCGEASLPSCGEA
mmetsp:Transcript_29433/g.83863  ORF Transcript_29433/g.83863 Transcript_29433/m.83863 type:complete len:93 (-) Transcript_29433:83-361(-)